MNELIRSSDLVLLSALKAALSAEGIEFYEFDGEIASTYGGLDSMPRRLMVNSDDLAAASSIARALCPDQFDG